MAEIVGYRFEPITIDGGEQARDVMLGLRRSEVTASGRARDNQRRARSIIDAAATAAPDLNADELDETARVREPLHKCARVAAETVSRIPIGGHRPRPTAHPPGRCHPATSMTTLEETIPLESLEIQMTELLERPLPANPPMRIARSLRHTLPRSARPISPGNRRPASSITDPNLTTEQYNEMLANVVRTVQPVGM